MTERDIPCVRSRRLVSASHSSALLLLSLVVIFGGVTADSQLDLLFIPTSISVVPSAQPMEWTSVADWMSSALGFTVQKTSSVLTIKDVFSLPKAIVMVEVSGTTVPVFGTKMATLEDNSEDLFHVLSARTEARFGSGQRLTVNVDPLRDVFDQRSAPHLAAPVLGAESTSRLANETNDVIMTSFSIEMEKIKEFLKSLNQLKAESEDHFRSLRTVISIHIRSLETILDTDYKEEVKTRAQDIVTDLIQEIIREMKSLFSNRVLIGLIGGHEKALVRRERETTTMRNTTLNVAHAYQNQFHTAFATVGFTSLVIALTVFSVSVCLWNIDPGKDSIIYRMTSQRIKKDQ